MKLRPMMLLAAAGFALAGMPPATAQSIPDAIAKAVSDPGRPEADTVRDAARKPAEMVAFAGIKSGDVVVDIMPGRGYFTRIFAKAVGASGHVYAVIPPRLAERPETLERLNMLTAAYPNVEVIVVDLGQLKLPRPADVIWTSENYHDFHNGAEPVFAALNAAIFAALKPGGTYYVEDHSAPGTGVSATSTLHRIDPAAVRSEVTAAGFKFVGQSDLLANPADTHALTVADPAIRGKTDKFALKFAKPR